MARNSRISETYRRRLRLSSRDVLVAAVVTALAGVAIGTAFWKPTLQGAQSDGRAEIKSAP
jgi:hypothetical protein